jgi:RNA polymerase sigma-70 factor (ECF subfamily)
MRPSGLGIDDIFDAHHGLVFRTAYRITGNAADAEDVLQTVFLRLALRNPGTGALDNPESYLRRSAVNVALDLVRSGKEHQSIPLEHAPVLKALQEPRDLRMALARAMTRLGRREAEVFALRFLEDQSNKEIAAALGISQVHVAVILHRARTAIRAELEQVQANWGAAAVRRQAK